LFIGYNAQELCQLALPTLLNGHQRYYPVNYVWLHLPPDSFLAAGINF